MRNNVISDLKKDLNKNTKNTKIEIVIKKITVVKNGK